MSTENIRSSLEKTIEYMKTHPEEMLNRATTAKAILEKDLKIRTNGPQGEVVITDMPPEVGGEGSAPTPGWYMQAALASCVATMIAMRTAQVGIELNTLEVSINTETDSRGIFGLDELIISGPLKMNTHIRIGAEGISEEKLHEIVKWCDKFSWVGNAICRSVPLKTKVEIV
jgi:uncharacterized OsmC-like protein